MTPSRSRRPSTRAALGFLVALAVFVLLRREPETPAQDSPTPAAAGNAAARYTPSIDEGLGVSVAIVLDNSGSMDDRARGDVRSKAQVAREAIERTLDATEAALRKRPDYPIKIGLILFSSTPRTVLAMQPYNRDSVRAALARLPNPTGGTAIGDAMHVAQRALYRAGTFRKVMLVITDGENNEGARPYDVAHEIHSRSEGGVGMYFVAFDTDPAKFGFLRDVKGDVVAAQNGDALQASLGQLYESKVLAESVTEPAPPASLPDRPSRSVR